MFIRDRTFQLSRSPERNVSHVPLSPSPLRNYKLNYCPPSIDLSGASSPGRISPLPRLPYKHTVQYRTGSTFSDRRNFSKQGKRDTFTSTFLDNNKSTDTSLNSLSKHKARQEAGLLRLTQKFQVETKKLEARKHKEALAEKFGKEYGVKLSPIQIAKYDPEKLIQIASKKFMHNKAYEAALKIQKCWEAYLIRKRIRAEGVLRHRAAICIQSHWKGFKQRKVFRGFAKRRNDAATTIQSCFRGFLVRLKWRVQVLRNYVKTEIDHMTDFLDYAKKSSCRMIWQHWLDYKARSAINDKKTLMNIIKQEKEAAERAKAVIRTARKKSEIRPLITKNKQQKPSVDSHESANEPKQDEIIFKDFKLDTFELHSAQVPLNPKYRRPSALDLIIASLPKCDDSKTAQHYIFTRSTGKPKNSKGRRIAKISI